MKFRTLAAAICCLAVAGVSAEEAEDTDYTGFEKFSESLDQEAAICLADKFTTEAIVNCASDEFDSWDQELNRVYQILMQRLHEDGSATLSVAQKAWLNYRDAEYRYVDELMSKKIGALYSIVYVGKRIDITKNRVSELYGHIHTLDN